MMFWEMLETDVCLYNQAMCLGVDFDGVMVFANLSKWGFLVTICTQLSIAISYYFILLGLC